MLKYNVKIAWRNLIKDRQFTFLNMLGLTAGLACTLLIYFWVMDELSVDKFFPKDSQIYQLMEHRKSGGDISISDESCGKLSETLVGMVPEIEYASPLAPPDWFQKFTLSVEEKNIKATGQYAGKDYFNIFSIPFLEGDRNTLLADKNAIVISDQLARKLFGSTENLIGKPVRFQQERNFFVSGVFKELPQNSSQQFDFVLSFEYYFDTQSWVKNWNATGPHNFVLLKKGADVNAFNRKIANVVTQNNGDTTRQAFAMKFSDNYLLNSFSHGSRTGGKMEYVRLFSLIAIFILAIACINFMNLSTAKASRRLKEVGIKKVVGAARRQLVIQFLAESTLLTLFAMALALCFAWILLPQFNRLTGKHIVFEFQPKLLAGMLTITAITGLLAGSYPALYLSGFNPLAILKGKMKNSLAEVTARKGLVVFQFTLSVTLIIAVMVVYKQIQYIQSANPGYNKDNIVRFDAEGTIQKNPVEFIAELKKIPGVVNASSTFNNMIGRNYGDNGLAWPGKNPNESVYFEGFGGSYDFVETLGMQLVAGRSFSKNFGDEFNKLVLNESAVAAMHLKDPVGKTITLFGKNKEIIGVVKDFHFESLHEPVKPSYLFLTLGEGNPWNKIMARIRAGSEKETVAAIQQLYEKVNPGFPFTFNFLDDAYQAQYISEVRVSIFSRYFAALAILISCLGLFGLATFTAQRRQKEIGIRKIVGASANRITYMLSLDFLKLVCIAMLIAFPVSWWAMNNWLQTFAYRIRFNLTIFLLAGILVIGLTLLTVCYQAIKAAIANPVKSLRSD